MKKSIVILMGCLLSLSASARGPDGRSHDSHKSHKSHEKEHVCDELKGGTPGLHGLCVSYCQARDLDDVAEAINPEKLKRRAERRERTLAEYNRKRKHSKKHKHGSDDHKWAKAGKRWRNRDEAQDDPAMPCVEEAAACPCWDATLTSTSGWMAKSTPPTCVARETTTQTYDFLLAGSPTSGDLARIMAVETRNPADASTSYTCMNQDTQSSMSMQQTISETDFLVCRSQIQSTCGLLGP